MGRPGYMFVLIWVDLGLELRFSLVKVLVISLEVYIVMDTFRV